MDTAAIFVYVCHLPKAMGPSSTTLLKNKSKKGKETDKTNTSRIEKLLTPW